MFRLVKRIPPLGFAAVLVGCVAGCGPKPAVGIVEGRVTQDGRDLPGIGVMFVPVSQGSTEGVVRSTGVTDQNGRYTLVRDDGQEGALTGSYRVCLIDTQAISRPKLTLNAAAAKRLGEAGVDLSKRKLPEQPAPRIALAYNDMERSPLPAVAVAPGRQVFDFDVPPPPKRPHAK